jgi:hypothetical protein
MCLIKGAFVGEKNFEPYQNARYNNKKKWEITLLRVFSFCMYSLLCNIMG